MPSILLKQGDKVRHPARPEWGIGSVTRVEQMQHDGVADLRVWVRFPTAGEKTLIAGTAELECVGEGAPQSIYSRQTLVELEASRGSGWLGSVTDGKVQELMTAVAPDATDPFLSIRRRLELTLGYYRFDGTGSKLIEWAIAQSGLDDPMTRFNRQELEQLHKRWLFNMDVHLGKLMNDARREPGLLDTLTAAAPPLAQRTVRRLLSNGR